MKYTINTESAEKIPKKRANKFKIIDILNEIHN